MSVQSVREVMPVPFLPGYDCFKCGRPPARYVASRAYGILRVLLTLCYGLRKKSASGVLAAHAMASCLPGGPAAFLDLLPDAGQARSDALLPRVLALDQSAQHQ
jgi:hypothetical protein